MHHSLLAVWNGAPWYLQPHSTWPIFKLFKDRTPALNTNWSWFSACDHEKASYSTIVANFTATIELAPPFPALPEWWRKWKVWPKLVATQWAVIYPQAMLTWNILTVQTYCFYWATIVAFRMLSVNSMHIISHTL